LAIEGTFYIKISGVAFTRAAGENMKLLVDQRVKMIDPGAEVKDTNFAGIHYLLEWSGVPLSLDKAQSLFRFMKVTIKKYFDTWTIVINIKLIETGE